MMATRQRRFAKPLMVIVGILVFAVFFIAEEDFRGAYAWKKYKREMEAQGERFDAARLIPQKVPDDQNFATARVFTTDNVIHLPDPPVKMESSAWTFGTARDLVDWARAFESGTSAAPRSNINNPVRAASFVLGNLKVYEPILAELQSASKRPYCHFNDNVPFEDWYKQDVHASSLAQLQTLGALYRLLVLHAEAQMVVGRTDAALADIQLMFRIDGGLKEQPFVVSQLLRCAAVPLLLQAVGQGLEEHRWSEDELKILQENLQRIDLLAPAVQSFQGERDICVNQAFDHGMYNSNEVSIFPSGWIRLEQLNINRAFQKDIFPRIDLRTRLISPSANRVIDTQLKEAARASILRKAFLHTIMAEMLMPAYSSVPKKIALSQSEVDLAMLACAIERYQLANGHCPERLDELVPKFVAVLPHDIINGQPLKYRRAANGRFILYSVGWNETDDGGAVGNKLDEGDWVWKYPDKN